MNARPLTDAQISQALRAHLPDAAAPGLRERVFEAAETTTQLRALPSFLGALSEADPITRRRSLLIAAALLVALALASAAAVGALRLFERDPIDKLSLEPPADLPAFVLSSYERLPQLPPVALTWHDSDSTKGRIYVDRSGAVRFDRFTSADATEPSSSTILSGNHRSAGWRTSGPRRSGSNRAIEAIGEDPRVFLRTVLSAGGQGPGCEMERDSSEVGNGTAAAGWRYVGLEYVAGRPTHHVTCGGGDLWIDIETRLILRTQGPAVDDAGQPIPVESTEVTEIAFGEQPAALFEPPEGVARMSADAYGAYICTAGDLPNEQVVGLGTREGCPTGSGGYAAARARAQPDAHRASKHERLRGSAGRPERADRSTGLDPGESEGGLARAGPPRARWRRERPADAPHLPRSHGRQRIQCFSLRRHPLGDGRHQRGAPPARLGPAARGSRRAMDCVWRRHR